MKRKAGRPKGIKRRAVNLSLDIEVIERIKKEKNTSRFVERAILNEINK